MDPPPHVQLPLVLLTRTRVCRAQTFPWYRVIRYGGSRTLGGVKAPGATVGWGGPLVIKIQEAPSSRKDTPLKGKLICCRLVVGSEPSLGISAAFSLLCGAYLLEVFFLARRVLLEILLGRRLLCEDFFSGGRVLFSGGRVLLEVLTLLVFFGRFPLCTGIPVPFFSSGTRI